MIKKIKQKYGNEVKIYFMGYSLAGLFAIWSLFLIEESNRYENIICAKNSKINGYNK